MKLKDPKTLVEQIALLMASFIWTVIVLVAIIFFWVYQDVQARWDSVLHPPPQAALAQAPPLATPSPTLWAGPGATLTPTPTSPPTPLATRVLGPEILPETLNPGETPIPVIVHTADEAQEFGVDQNQPVTVNYLPTATPGPGDAARFGGSVPTHLTIESVGIDADVIPVGWSVIQKDGLEYSIWQVADYAVGWHKTTALLGQPGNTVMAGHHNVNGEVFRDLVNVEVGDKVVITAGDRKIEYVVDLKTIVKEKGEPVEVRKRNAQWIAPTADERVTFVTCWPYTNNTHRVIVVAKPVTG